MKPQSIVQIRNIGKQKTRDITVDSDEHLFYANGIAVSNSHAVSYAMLTAWQLYLKTHFFPEFMCCFLNRTTRVSKNKYGDNLMNIRISYARKNSVPIYGPDVNKSKQEFTIQDGGIRFGLACIKGISSAADEIVKHQPYKDIEDFCNRTSSTIIHKGRFENLIFAGAFDCFGKTREEIYNWYFNEYRNPKKKQKGMQLSLFDKIIDNEVNEDIEYIYFSDDELVEKELDILGVNLYKDIFNEYAEIVKENKIKRINEVLQSTKKRVNLLFRIESVNFVRFKKGTSDFYLIKISDGWDIVSMYVKSFVFEKSKPYKLFEIGNVLFSEVKVNNKRDGFSFEEKSIPITKVLGKTKVMQKK